MLGRPWVATGSQACVSHATTSPPSPTAARRSRSWGGPFGSQTCSSSRDPLDAHRPAHRPRQEGGVARRVLGAGLAVGSGAVQVDQPHLVPREPEEPGERLAEAVRRLGRRPDRGAVGADVRHAARRAEGAVRLDGPPVRRAERLHAGAGRAERGSGRPSSPRPGRARPGSRGPRRRASAWSGSPVPADHWARSARAARTASHSRSATTPRKLPMRTTRAPGNRRDRRLVDRLERGAGRGRPDHPPVEHPGERQVLDVEVAPRDLRGDVRPAARTGRCSGRRSRA